MLHSESILKFRTTIQNNLLKSVSRKLTTIFSYRGKASGTRAGWPEVLGQLAGQNTRLHNLGCHHIAPTSRRTPFHSLLLSDHFRRHCFCSPPQASSPKGGTKEMFSKGWAISAISHLPPLPVLWTKDKLFPQPLPELSSHLFFHLRTMIIKVTTPNQKMKKHAVTKTWHCRFPGSHQLTTLVTKVVLTFARFCREHQAKA